MRVITLTHVFPRWDGDPSAAFLATWTRALRAAGHDVRVIAPHDRGLPEVDVVEDTPVRLVRYAGESQEVLAYRGEMHKIATRPIGPPLVATLLWQMAAAVRRAVRRWEPDLLHVHWWVPGAIVARMARVDIPVVVHLHGTDVGVVEGRPRLRALARWALDGAARVETVSADLARRTARAIGVQVAARNPMPIELDRFRPVQPVVSLDRPTILGVGRLVPEKGFGDLIVSAALTGRDVTVRLVGDGPAARSLRTQAEQAGVRLELVGRLEPAALREEYAAAELVVQPSHREGLGLVAAEAALLGRPVVATDSGGVREFFDGALLVPVGNVGRLARKMNEQLDDPDLAAVARAATRARQLLDPAAAVERTVAGWQAVTA